MVRAGCSGGSCDACLLDQLGLTSVNFAAMVTLPFVVFSSSLAPGWSGLVGDTAASSLGLPAVCISFNTSQIVRLYLDSFILKRAQF